VRTVWRPAFLLLVALTIVTGVIYPLVVTGIGALFFPRQTRGSLIVVAGRVVGSSLIGQSFEAPGDFWGRPSASAGAPYNAGASAGSNLGPTSPVLERAVRARLAALRAADPDNPAAIPADLVTASASGLDPDIRPESAEFQVRRVARVRGLDPTVLNALVERHVERRTFGVLGEPRVNVLELNLALDAISRGTAPERADTGSAGRR
jgi:K+-transporting ATPase ATPase C chain